MSSFTLSYTKYVVLSWDTANEVARSGANIVFLFIRGDDDDFASSRKLDLSCYKSINVMYRVVHSHLGSIVSIQKRTKAENNNHPK